MKNIDKKTVTSFGDEWSRFNQEDMNELEKRKIFDDYFSIFPMNVLSADAVGFDMGCGSGRWSKFVAPKVKLLNCIDPSEAIDIAQENLKEHKNINYFKSSVDDQCLQSNSQDFGYSLGVLHHIPDTQAAILSCVEFLKPGAPILFYLYYAFDDRPFWFKTLWKISNLLRIIISKLPSKAKHLVTDMIALLVYLPLARLSKVISYMNLNYSNVPLSYYKNNSFYTMRTDSRDRFGTPLEQRFSKYQIKLMLENAGLINITFSNEAPFWCVLGYKKI
jgi:SAM-dependent methyltransferase